MANKYIFTILIFLWVTGQKLINSDNKKVDKRNSEPKEINVDTFLDLWLQNTSDPREPRLKEFKVDSTYTYFTRKRSSYKIKNMLLNKIDYKALEGDLIRNLFYTNVIPPVDREKQKHCSTASINFDYQNKFLEHDQAIEITCLYKVKCEFVIPIVKKSYVALYDLKTKALR